jgi:hypothetical protein
MYDSIFLRVLHSLLPLLVRLTSLLCQARSREQLRWGFVFKLLPAKQAVPEKFDLETERVITISGSRIKEP